MGIPNQRGVGQIIATGVLTVTLSTAAASLVVKCPHITTNSIIMLSPLNAEGAKMQLISWSATVAAGQFTFACLSTSCTAGKVAYTVINPVEDGI